MTPLTRERETVEVSEAAMPEGSGAGEPDHAIPGDRGIPSINRARSLQSRASSVLTLALISALGLGLLAWYYARILSRPAEAHHTAQAAARSRAQAELALPPLPPAASPFARPQAAPRSTPDPPAIERLLGPAPPEPATAGAAGGTPAAVAAVPGAPQTLHDGALRRRLAGPAFARGSNAGEGTPPATPSAENPGATALAAATPQAGDAAPASPRGLGTLLRPTVTPAVTPSMLPTRRFLLGKGTFIDCTLETAIESELPGLTTCITATDTFGADGTVVLLERGTKLVGETRGQVEPGGARIFVLWTEARTPTGVVVPLASPGTDALGRSGLAGEVNRHFWERFGAAILLTVINGAVQGAVNSQNSSGSVVVSPSTSTDVMGEILRGTVSIPPTVSKAQGDRIQVLVARDVDFRAVYALRVAHPAGSDPKP